MADVNGNPPEGKVAEQTYKITISRDCSTDTLFMRNDFNKIVRIMDDETYEYRFGYRSSL